jgi:peptidoglycan hydrolase CwlO-like protein
MGRKRSGARKQIYLCVAILIFLTPSACTFNRMMSSKIVDATGEEAKAHQTLGRKYLAQGEFGNALKENEKVLSLTGRNVPTDESLFYIGLIHAHPANPARDYGRSIDSLRTLINKYPNSPLTDQAKTLLGLLQDNEKLIGTVEKLNRTVDDLKTKQDRLNRMIDELKTKEDQLNSMIDELKKVDIGVEQKKREKIK